MMASKFGGYMNSVRSAMKTGLMAVLYVLSCTAIAAKPEVQSDASWQLHTEIDGMTDKVTRKYAWVAAANGAKTSLVVECSSGKPEVLWVILGEKSDPLGSPPRPFAPAYRFDKQPAATVPWTYGLNGGYLRGDSAMQFVHGALLGAQHVLVRSVKPTGETHDQTFSMHGAAEAISQVLESCR